MMQSLGDMRMREFGDTTQSDYLCVVRNFAKHPGRWPDAAFAQAPLQAFGDFLQHFVAGMMTGGIALSVTMSFLGDFHE